MEYLRRTGKWFLSRLGCFVGSGSYIALALFLWIVDASTAYASVAVDAAHTSKYRYFNMPSAVSVNSAQAACDYPYGSNVWIFIDNGNRSLCTKASECNVGACYYQGVKKTDVYELMTCPAKSVENSSSHICYLSFDPRKDCCSNEDGNPINRGSGIKRQRETDFALSTILLKRVFAYYPWWTNKNVDGPFGNGWSSNLHSRRIAIDTSTSPTTAQAVRGDSKQFTFSLVGATWVADNDIVDRLTEIKNVQGVRTNWGYYDAATENTEQYDSEGNLQKVTSRVGLITSWAYNASGQLESVTEPFGRVIRFTNDALGRVIQMADPAGALYDYSYDSGNRLVSVTYPADTEGIRHQRTYLYENASLANALTGIIDENKWRLATFNYDGEGFGIETKHHAALNADAEDYSFSYGANFANTTVTDPLGTQRTYTFSINNNTLRQTGISLSCINCGGTVTESVIYDAYGNVASRTDFNGNKTCNSYDLTRNLETARIEGAANSTTCSTVLSAASLTAPMRKVTTTWHATYRLPTAIAEPKKITTFSYDTAGNLLTKTVQATTDATGAQAFSSTLTGAADQWTYTYNAVGQVLTIDGPRTDATDKITYAYDTSGNLVTITNAAGHVTTLSNYDAHGHAGRIVDPNGIATDLTYHPRGWLASSTVTDGAAVETTTYAYDGVGQLTGVTLPKGAKVHYTYDDAHRLTAIADNLGNKITYTLDNMGNRINEQVKDPGGALARQTSRLYDALNRLQQVTGGAQ